MIPKLEPLRSGRLKSLASSTKDPFVPLVKRKVNLRSPKEMFISNRTRLNATKGEKHRFLRYQSLQQPEKRDTRIVRNGRKQ